MMNKSETVSIIRSLLSSVKFSCSVYNLNKDFKKETGIDIPLFGYSNISEFLSSIPDTVEVTGIYPVQQVSLVENEKSAHIVSLVKRQKSIGAKKNMCKSKQRMHSPKYLNFRSCNEENKREKFDELTKIGEEKNGLNSGMNINKIEHKFPFSNNRISKCLEIESQGVVPKIDIKVHAQVGHYIEVYPCFVISPHKFYFHLRQLRKGFQQFNSQLQTYFSYEENVKSCTPSDIKLNKAYVAFNKIDQEPCWLRFEVIDKISDFQILVNFIDYGKKEKILIRDAKVLDKKFVGYPKQAILGSSANIRPVDDLLKWSPCSKKRFKDLVLNKNLVGGVVHVDHKSPSLELALSRTDGPELHVNDVLVKEGYAQFVNANLIEVIEARTPDSDSSDTHYFNQSFNYLKTNQLPSPLCFSSQFLNNNSRLKKLFADDM